jgi:predicted site-specific integrase-resolvase
MSNLLNETRAAKHLGLAPNTLAGWRCSGKVDLPFIKIGRNIRYRLDDIEAFLQRNTQRQTEVK